MRKIITNILILVVFCMNLFPVCVSAASVDVSLETNAQQNALTAACSTAYDSIVWEISDAEDGGFATIPGAETDTYIPSVEDANKYIRAKVTVDGNEYSSGAAEIKPQYLVKDEFDANAAADLANWTVKAGTNCITGTGSDSDGTGYLYMNQSGSVFGEASRFFDAVTEKTVITSRFKNEAGQVNLFYVRSGSNPAMNMNIPDGNIKATYGNGSGGTQTSVLVDSYSTDTWYDLMLVINPVGNTVSSAVDIYIGTNGDLDLICQGVPMRSSVSNLNNIWFVKSQNGRFLLDYLRVYSSVQVVLPEMTDEQAVELDTQALTSDVLTSQNPFAITEDLNLPTIGANGSQISWLSNNSDVIDIVGNSGEVSRNHGNAYVTLTASISKGEREQTKEFSYLVLKNPEEEISALVDMQFNSPEHSFETTPSENAVVEDGVLKIHNHENPNESTGDVKTTFTKVTNNVFIEGDIKITANSANIFYIRNGGATALNFNYSGGTLNCRHGDMTIGGNVIGSQSVVSNVAGQWVHLKIFMDFDNQKADVYVNSEKILSNVDFRSSVQEIDGLLFGKPSAGAGNIYIDNIKVYEPQTNLAEIMGAVNLPMETDEDFSLLQVAENASITWMSLNPEYINIDGETASVTRPAVNEQDITVQVVGIFESDTVIDSKVYDVVVKRELTDAEAVAKAVSDFEWENVSDEAIGAVKSDFHLPQTMKNGVSVQYTYAPPEYATGNQIIRPLESDVSVKLTVRFERNGITAEEEYIFTILNLKDDPTVDKQALLQADVNSIDLGNLSAVTTNLVLPANGQNGTSFVWESTNKNVISNSGSILRGESNKSAYITVTATLLGERMVKNFYVTVKGTGNGGGGFNGGGVTTGGFAIVGSGGGVTTETPAITEQNASIFVDIDSVEWAKNSIVSLVKKGVISVNETKTFEPDRYITREEAIKMIVVAFGVEGNNATSKFADVDPNAWYSRYVAAAENAGLTNGISEDRFGVAMNITRQDSVVMLYNALDKYFELKESGATKTFDDSGAISDYAQTPVTYFNEQGIVTGYQDNTFKPGNNITRAEFATILVRALDSIQ